MRSTVCHARSRRISIDSPRDTRTVGVAISVRQRGRFLQGRSPIRGRAVFYGSTGARRASGYERGPRSRPQRPQFGGTTGGALTVLLRYQVGERRR